MKVTAATVFSIKHVSPEPTATPKPVSSTVQAKEKIYKRRNGGGGGGKLKPGAGFVRDKLRERFGLKEASDGGYVRSRLGDNVAMKPAGVLGSNEFCIELSMKKEEKDEDEVHVSLKGGKSRGDAKDSPSWCTLKQQYQGLNQLITQYESCILDSEEDNEKYKEEEEEEEDDEEGLLLVLDSSPAPKAKSRELSTSRNRLSTPQNRERARVEKWLGSQSSHSSENSKFSQTNMGVKKSGVSKWSHDVRIYKV